MSRTVSTTEPNAELHVLVPYPDGVLQAVQVNREVVSHAPDLAGPIDSALDRLTCQLTCRALTSRVAAVIGDWQTARDRAKAYLEG